MPVDSGGVVPELASPGDVPALAGTFAAAFGDDAMIRWPMPGTTPAMLAELFRVILAPCAESGVLWKIGGCDGGAVWLPPGVAGRFAEIEQSTRAVVSSLTGDGGARYAAFWDWLDAHLPGEPCWFLDLVGVAPGAQGRGLGRALVRHGSGFAYLATLIDMCSNKVVGWAVDDHMRTGLGGIWRLPERRLKPAPAPAAGLRLAPASSPSPPSSRSSAAT